MAERPRRSTRQSVKTPRAAGVSTSIELPVRAKRKQEVTDPAESLRFLLENTKSTITTIDISDVFNNSAWHMLSEESRAELKKLLPPTTQSGYCPTLGSDHPASDDAMAIDSLPTALSDADVSSVFTDPHFLAAAHTFQDHLYSNWLSTAHQEKVKKFEDGIRDGSLAAPWKDEVWEKENPLPEPSAHADVDSLGPQNFNLHETRAGGAAQVKLMTLARKGVIRVGDVVAYRRHFSALDIIVEKDVIVQSISQGSSGITILTELGTTKFLPAHLLHRSPSDPSSPTRSMTITSPTMLETGLLDIDGRIEKALRPNGNAWKCFTVWRWRGTEDPSPDFNTDRGGRESHGTLFYLRGSYYHEHC